MPELSKEMKNDLLKELKNDALRFAELIDRLAANDWNKYHQTGEYSYSSYDMDKLEYVTSQMRLKLKILGASRIYEQEQ